MLLRICGAAFVAVALWAAPARCGEITTDLSARTAAYRPWDGIGRYTMAKADGVRPIQGLVTLSQRFGAKPYDQLSEGDGRWASERVIFRDVDTGATVMRLTNDRWTDQLSYFQGNWSADGRFVVFRRRPGMWEASTATHGPMVMNADGTGLRNAFRDYPMVSNVVCSPTEPDVCYGTADRDTRIIAFSLSTGKQIREVHAVKRGWHMKISPDGKYLMSRAELSNGGKGIWVASVDGKEFYEASIPEAIHDSYRFHPTLKKIIYWYESDHGATFWQCDFDGANKVAAKRSFDWNHGDIGPDRMVHTGGKLLKMLPGGWAEPQQLYQQPGEEYYDDPYDFNGYSTWRPQDQLWSYHTRICFTPYVSELFAAWADAIAGDRANRYRVCFTGIGRGSALDCPNASPDGTKVLFNSNMFGHNGIYQVVARLPERPTGLQSAQVLKGVELNWTPARHHAEIAGYHVYRSERTGEGFAAITTSPINTVRCIDASATPGKTYFYAITAVEHSGLESALSDEVVAGTAPPQRRIYLKTHTARLSPEMWVAFEGDAADLHYIWMRKKGGTGKATISLEKPLSGSCTLWARAKGHEGVQFAVSAGSQTVTVASESSERWKWVKASAPLNLSNTAQIDVTSRTYGSAVDEIVLSFGDEAFVPARDPRVLWPSSDPVQQLQAEAISPFVTKLRWAASTDPTVHHYNVYCGADQQFTPSQATLVASPNQPSLVDWGLKPGANLFYRLTSVNRAGNESPASPAIKVTLPAINPVAIEKDYADRIEFNAPATGTYAVWLRAKRAQGRSGVYVDVKVDAKGTGSWVATLDGRDKQQQAWINYDQWGRFDLAAGPHVLTIANKSGFDIDRVFITNDLYRKPEGNVNVLNGW